MIAHTKDSSKEAGRSSLKRRATPPPPRAHIISHSRGRTRIGVPRKRRDRAYFEKLKQGLEKAPGVTRVEVNPLTGSGLIFHELGLEGLEKLGRDTSLFQVVEEVLEETPLGHKVARGLGVVNEELRTISDNRIDLAGLTFVGLLGAAVYQAFQGNLLAPASTLLGDALRVLPKRHTHALTDELDLRAASEHEKGNA